MSGFSSVPTDPLAFLDDLISTVGGMIEGLSTRPGAVSDETTTIAPLFSSFQMDILVETFSSAQMERLMEGYTACLNRLCHGLSVLRRAVIEVPDLGRRLPDLTSDLETTCAEEGRKVIGQLVNEHRQALNRELFNNDPAARFHPLLDTDGKEIEGFPRHLRTLYTLDHSSDPTLGQVIRRLGLEEHDDLVVMRERIRAKML